MGRAGSRSPQCPGGRESSYVFRRPPRLPPRPFSCPLRTASETEWFRVALPQPHVCLGRMKSCGKLWLVPYGSPPVCSRGSRVHLRSRAVEAW